MSAFIVKDLLIGINIAFKNCDIKHNLSLFGILSQFPGFSETKAGLQSDLNKNSHGTSNFKICKDTGRS